MTNNAADDTAVKISKNGDMVWVGPGINGNADIFVYDGVTFLTKTLTNSISINGSPQINDNGDVVWVTLNSVELDWNVMLYTKATNQIKRISLPKDPNYPHNDTNPRINNNGQAVYQSRNLGTDHEIMFYDGATVTQATNNASTDESPILNDNGDIVWMQSVVNTGISDIYLRDGATKAITPITATPVNEMNPRINNTGDIVWTGWDGGNYQVYYYRRSTPATTKLTTSAHDNFEARINSNAQIVWGQQSSSDQEIFFRNGLNGTNTNISNNANKDDGSPQLNDNGWVAWNEDQGTTGTNHQIFVWDGTTVTRFTNDTYDHIFPAINNSNEVAWQGTGGTGTSLTDYELHMATTGICAGVVCNDNNACTINDCQPVTGCVYTPIICNDNNACTTDTCNTATGCVYTPIVCNDNNACTDNRCDTTTGCWYPAIVCTDNNACTTDTCNTTTGCLYTPLSGINDNNVCTTDTCNTATGVISHTAVVCNDNNLCTTDTCNTTTGCVYTPLAAINDNNPCTTDTCDPATGAITRTQLVCNDNNACTADTCDTTTGKCAYTPNDVCAATINNNFTMLDTHNNVVGGTNDIYFSWDGVKKTSVAASGQIANALLTSSCIYSSSFWSAHDLAVYGPGTYTVYTACPAGSPGCGLTSDPTGINCPVGNTCPPITFTVKTGEIGIHMLFNWGGNTNIDVVNVLKPNAVFAPSPMASVGPYFCGFNSSCTVWGWMSYDADGDGLNGIRMVDGPFPGFSPNFIYNKGTVDPCCDAATRCNDNNACTTDTCDPATGACMNATITCNDNNACTTDTCNTTTGCVYTPVAINDNNPCTTDACNTATGVITHTLKNCNDNNACTNDYCNTTGVCANTTIFCADGNACTTDTCNTATGCVFTAINCADGNVCTTDSCNTATGCVYPNNTLACTDNNACTENDVCSGGVCVVGTPKVCTVGSVCNPAIGACLQSGGAISNGNNFSLIATNGYIFGGTNDVKFTWDSTVQDAATFANGNGPSNATLTSDEPLNYWLWYAKHVQVVAPGTYWVDLDGSGPSTNRYEVTIPSGKLGVHLLLDFGEQVGAATSCGKTDCDVDVWMVWELNKAVAAGQLYTGVDDGTSSNGPAWDEPYPLPFVIDGRPNADGKVWGLASIDLAGRIYNATTGATITNLPLDGISGIKVKEGSYNGTAMFNFSVKMMDPCADAVTRCNDGNACTDDKCIEATGECIHPVAVCNDGTICTTDTCNTATGCVFTPKNCNDNNACTIDFCTPTTGACLHPAVFCKDTNVCTTDTCNTATGCVFTNNTVACSDNNACTVSDLCSNGVCVLGTPKSCTNGGVCATATGCPVSGVATSGNNFTLLLANGYILGGTNDVKFTWDGTVQNATTFANGNGPSNATISSDEPLHSWLWYAKHVQVVGPGTYWVDLDGSGPSLNRYEVTIPAGRLGAHMLLDWGETGQATSCGKTNCDVDVWIAWDYNNAFTTGKMFTGIDDGSGSTDAPAMDDPYPMPYAIDGASNASTKAWNLVSFDLAGRIANSTGGTLKELPLDGIPGIKLKEGSYENASINFNFIIE